MITKQQGNTLIREAVYFFDDSIVFYQKLSVFLLGTIPIECPTGCDRLFVECPQYGLLDFVRNGHVVFNCVETTENEVKQADLGNKIIDVRNLENNAPQQSTE